MYNTMNTKKRKCESFTDRKLVQLDISDSFTRWKESVKMKKSNRKRKFLPLVVSPIVIPVDSDTEPEDCIDYISAIANRALPFPFTLEEEEKKDERLEQIADSCVNASTPTSEIVYIGVNKPQLNSQVMHPKACSTPLNVSGSRMKNDHVGVLELSSILASNTKTNSESDTDSDRTIIEQETTLLVQSVNIINHVIIPRPVDKSSSDVSQKQIGNESAVRKRIAEEEAGNKKQKISHSDRYRKHVSKKLFGGEDENKQTLNNSQNCTVVSEPNCSRSPKKRNSNTDAKHEYKMGNHKETTPKRQRGVHLEAKPENQQLEKSNKEDESGELGMCKGSKSPEKVNVNKTAKKDVNKDSSVQLTKSTNISKAKKLPRSERKQTPERAPPKSPAKVTESTNIVTETTANKVEPVQPCKSVPNVGKGNTLHAEDLQTLNKAVSRSSSNSSQNVKVAESVSVAARKDSSKDDTAQGVPNIDKGKSLLKRVGENPPSTKADWHSSGSSPEKKGVNKSAKIESKIEGRRMNTKYVTLLNELFNTVYETKYIDNLLDDDRKAVDIYCDMKPDYQYVCIKLFTWKRKWYNIYKFCQKIHLDIGDSNICQMYNFLVKNGIVDTDFIKDDRRILLELLDPIDLKSIRDSFKLKKSLIKKHDIIDALLKNSITQSTLTPKKSTQDILMKEVERRLGYSVRLNEDFRNAFYRAYVLATFANPVFSKMTDYFRNILHLRVAFPETPIEEYTIFYTKSEFVRYVTARKYKDELEDILGKFHRESLEICKLIFQELRKTESDENEYAERYKNTPHLAKFTARAVYVNALSNAMKILATKFPLDVKEWLEYMIKEVSYSHRIGEWYDHLSRLYMNYLEPRDYTHAAELIIEVLQEKRVHLSEVQLHLLGKRGEALKVSKKYKIFQLYHDRIAELVPAPIDVNGFPSRTIDATAIRSNEMGKKRSYFNQDKDGNKTYTNVEYVALIHYIKEDGYTDGEHCEGSLIRATFTLFFWDIIYSAKETVPGTFISKIQSEPLDMRSKYFYLNRKDAIDRRLEEIETTWSHSELIKFVKDKHNKYSHLSSFCEVGAYINNAELLEVLVDCIGRVVLARIYRRYVKNIRHYQSGLPDLLVWNDQIKKSKFVEVKGENDKLSMGQTLWLDYLRSIGADIEVCKVHSIGSKRKISIQQGQQAEKSIKPSTSSSNMEVPKTHPTGSKPKKNIPKREDKGSAKPSETKADIPKQHSIGSKSKKIPQKTKDKKLTEPSTSSSPD